MPSPASPPPAPRYAFLVLEDHPYGREMLRALLEVGMVPALVVEERSAASELERDKFLERFAGFPIAPTFTELLEGLDPRPPRHKVASHNDPACAAILREAGCDLLVLGGTRILRRHVFETAAKAINAHPGLLPEVRGSASVAWAIERDLPIGCTTHLIDAGVDTGPIIERETIPVHRGDSYEKLCYETCRLSARMMTRAVLAEACGRLEVEAQAGEGITHRNMPAEGVAAVKAKLAAGRYRHTIEVPITGAAIELACDDLSAELDFFGDQLGFRVESIFPAHAPRAATLRGHGLRLRLRGARSPGSSSAVLALESSASPLPTPQLSPGGTRVEWVPSELAVASPKSKSKPKLVVRRASEGTSGLGRAGMRYRDLLPETHGGAFIASHICIPEGGPVPDYVHYHQVHAQLIYCHRGWVEVVYEDQGEPFIMRAGDCVLQPPTIRHRVLAASPGLEVIEVSSPAEHETLGDLQLELPNGAAAPGKRYAGQGFHLHRGADVDWVPAPEGLGVFSQDLGMSGPTEDRVWARMLRGDGDGGDARLPAADGWESVERELNVVFVTAGEIRLHVRERADAPAQIEPLAQGDCVTLPPGASYQLAWTGAEARVLELRINREPGSATAP